MEFWGWKGVRCSPAEVPGSISGVLGRRERWGGGGVAVIAVR